MRVGNPEVAEVKTYGRIGSAMDYLASVENESDHPLAKAVLNHLEDVQKYHVEEADVVKGGGVKAVVDDHDVAVGNVVLMEQEQVKLTDEIKNDIQAYEERGNSLFLLPLMVN